VSVAEVLLAGLTRADPGPEATPAQKARFRGHETLTRALIEFWGPKSVSDVDAHQALEYRAWRAANVRLLKGGRPAGAGPVSARTLNNQLEHLRTQLNAFAAEHDCNWPPVALGSLEHDESKPVEIIARSDIARLVWATRGVTYEPDESASAMARTGLKPACFRPASGEVVAGTRKRLRSHLGRLLLICYYSGSTASCATRLRWGGDPDGEDSFVDLDAGLLYRLGPDAAPGKAAGMPVPICPRLLLHLRNWRIADARDGLSVIIHVHKLDKTRSVPQGAFRATRADAGYRDGEVELAMLRNATAAELMMRGVDVRSAALFMGMERESFGRRFERSHHKFHEGARLALQTRPATIRSMPDMSVTWRAARGRRTS
jgi:hypothetical protein